MAKEVKQEQKTDLYLLAIVSIVAIVGIVVLVLNAGAGSVFYSNDDLSGQGTRIAEWEGVSKEELKGKLADIRSRQEAASGISTVSEDEENEEEETVASSGFHDRDDSCPTGVLC